MKNLKSITTVIVLTLCLPFGMTIFNYCESTIVCGLPNFFGFHGKAKPRNLVTNRKEIPIDLYTENLKTMNSRLHELVFLSLSTNQSTFIVVVPGLSSCTHEKDQIFSMCRRNLWSLRDNPIRSFTAIWNKVILISVQI